MTSSVDHVLDIDDQLDHRIESGTSVLEILAQDLGLAEVSRITVEQETVRGVRLAEPVGNHVVGDGIGHELAGVHVDLGPEPERRGLADVGPEDVSGRDLRDGEAISDDLCLSPLASAWWADQYQPH
jgi:hypothetical protein